MTIGLHCRRVLTIVLVTLASLSHGKCVQVFYDQGGRSTAMLVQNLLGHFPKVDQIISPIEKYSSGELDRCSSNLYLGTYFDNQIPKVFLDDFVVSKSRVAWLGYNIWQLPEEVTKNLWGVTYRELSKLDTTHLDSRGQPGFFRHYDYKGETFEKYGEYEGPNSTNFQSAFEITLFNVVSSALEGKVVSWARHSTSGEKAPYILRSDKRWYVGDIPTSFMTEEDRYLIFADLLFDILDEASRFSLSQRPALVRLEDVHAALPSWQLNGMADLFERHKISYAISLIPIFSDPYKVVVSESKDQHIELSDRPEVVQFLKRATTHGASIIYHGVTHQYEDVKNPTGVSGYDYEFWDTVHGTPVPLDSVNWVVSRLEKGMAVMEAAHVKPTAWVTPHYGASPLDDVLFSELFTWVAGRFNYVSFTKRQTRELPASLKIDVSGASGNGKRLQYLQDLAVTSEGNPEGQFFPYEIYRDALGGGVIPEDLGYLQISTDGIKPDQLVDVDRMIARMKRNLVIRDAWASFFIHPSLLENHNGKIVQTQDLDKLISSAQALGYHFMDLDVWTKHQHRRNTPRVTEIH